MKSRVRGWLAVWTLIAIVCVLGYPSGQSTLVFGFWPSNHFIAWAVTLLCTVVGGIFAYDMFYYYYPEFDADVIKEIENGDVETEYVEQEPMAANRGDLE